MKELVDGEGRAPQPRRFALRFSPPTLIVEFSVGAGTKRKVYHQRIFLKALSATSVCGEWGEVGRALALGRVHSGCSLRWRRVGVAGGAESLG